MLAGCASDTGSASCDDDAVVAVNQNGEYEGSAKVIVVSRDGGTDLVTGDGVATKPSFSPDGRRLVVVRAVGDYESAGPVSTSLWIVGTDGSDRRRLTEEGLDNDPAWSPEGEQIVFSEEDPSVQYASRLATVPVEGGEPRPLLPGAGARDIAPAWSPDGRRIAFVRTGVEAAFEDASIWVLDADGSNAREIVPLPSAHSIDWLPDGKTLLVSSFAQEDGKIAVVNIDNGGVREAIGHASLAAVSGGDAIYFLTKDGASQAAWWRLARGELIGERLERERFVGRFEDYVYPYFGLAANPCSQ
jgi:dipeptidyl aminopeptidase/acylaminoacyl peptidase